MRVYISGKVTGEDLNECRKKFLMAEEKLTAMGYDVINPLKVSAVLPELEYEEYMKIDFALLDLCHGIYFLPDHIESTGALLEKVYAKKYGIVEVKV